MSSRIAHVDFERHFSIDDDMFTIVHEDGTRALAIVFGLWSTMPARLLELCRARRTAAVYNRCPICGSDGPPSSFGKIGFSEHFFEHAQICPAADDIIGPMIRAWLFKVGDVARGKRLNEPIEQPWLR